jgi:hypothetical protein
MEEVLNVVPVKVSSLIMNQGLDAPLWCYIVENSPLWDVSYKSLRAGWFSCIFFLAELELVWRWGTKAILMVLAREDSPGVVNKTFIVMIPKVASPKSM